MDPFFTGMAPDTALELAELSRRMYALRETRKGLLASTGEADADALLAALRAGRLPEHPAYDSWLSVIVLERAEVALRTRIDWRCRHPRAEAPSGADDDSGLSALLAEVSVPETFASVQVHPDGVSFVGPGGLNVVARIAWAHDWAVEWHLDGRGWRLDTAPVAHPDVATRAHLHRPDGTVVADPLALETGNAAVVLQTVLDALARDALR